MDDEQKNKKSFWCEAGFELGARGSRLRSGKRAVLIASFQLVPNHSDVDVLRAQGALQIVRNGLEHSSLILLILWFN